MKLVIKKSISFILCLALLSLTVSTVYAGADYGTFIGTISALETVELSNIEIQVFSATPVYTSPSDVEAAYYGEQYEFSVYTDDDGAFTFDKPSQYCSITVVLDTLPNGFGISQQTQFVAPASSGIELTISSVADVDVSFIYDELIPEFHNSEGDIILTEYTVVPSTSNMNNHMSASATSCDLLDQINSLSTFTHCGMIQTSGGSFPYVVEEDVSCFSLLGKIEYLCSNNVITEEEKISLYCDLTTPALGTKYDVYSNTLLYSSIQSFDKNTNTNNSSIAAKVDQTVAEINSTPSYDAYTSRTIGSFSLKVFYDTREGMTYSVAGKIADEFVNIYNYFVISKGFMSPAPLGTSYYAIYLVPSSEVNGGVTTSDVEDGTSYIRIGYNTASSSTYNVTLAHEFHHAIMTAYHIPLSSNVSGPANLWWFKEGFCSFAAMVYTGNNTKYANFINTYLSNSNLSIFNTSVENMQYGTLVFPLYIYTYLGGWNAIKDIYLQYENAGNPFDAITNSSYVSTYRSAFSAMVTRNYKPTAYYTYATASWGTGIVLSNLFPPAMSSRFVVHRMACHYQKFESTTNIGTAYFTIEINATNTSGFYLNKITETATGALSITTVSTNFTRVTVPQANFGATIKKVILVPINTNTTGSSMMYTISASTTN